MKKNIRITQRDIKILKLCHEQKFLTLDQIVRTFFPESKNKYKVPLRCVNRLMSRGILRACKQGNWKITLYLLGLKGMRILKAHNLLNGLPYIKAVDWESYEHDLQVTDVRLIFEKLGFEWIPQRLLKKIDPRRKFSDGKAKFGNHIFSVEVEKDGTKHETHEWIFQKRCRDRLEEVILYVVKDEKTKASRLREARDYKRIYFVTLDELRERKEEAEFINSDDGELVLLDLIYPAPQALDKNFELFRKADRDYAPVLPRTNKKEGSLKLRV